MGGVTLRHNMDFGIPPYTVITLTLWFYRGHMHTHTHTQSEQFGGGTKAGPAPLTIGHFQLALVDEHSCPSVFLSVRLLVK